MLSNCVRCFKLGYETRERGVGCFCCRRHLSPMIDFLETDRKSNERGHQVPTPFVSFSGITRVGSIDSGVPSVFAPVSTAGNGYNGLTRP
ncbi:hypothetical protein JTE90_002253 [Oedothorax gibbosus]|uniref:Uncharacterized protein n=1 Tax=Oedothorax gibbosus TaxID=931172 RepID=A0AAV6V7Y5_9ARAC|nr:hypothetical protein JTE90_002253 [Oedothorax gibbosus]